MTTIRDIYNEALAMKTIGFSARQVADKIVKLGHDNGFAAITEHSSRNHSGIRTIELVFALGATIYFDGFDWRYLKTR
jgi:hypothetical protein